MVSIRVFQIKLSVHNRRIKWTEFCDTKMKMPELFNFIILHNAF